VSGDGRHQAVVGHRRLLALRSLLFLPEPLEELGQRENPQRHPAAGAALLFGISAFGEAEAIANVAGRDGHGGLQGPGWLSARNK
jgi:hypothetical protein